MSDVFEENVNPHLLMSEEKLSLKISGFSPIFAEFSASFWDKRKAAGKKQGLIRAVKPSFGLKIIDATAGFGRDSAILARFGAEVLMLERHPLVCAVLQDALLRADSTEQALRLSLHAGDALAYLNALDERHYPDVIYIDPMHPERTKSALVKKEMQVLQKMIGADEDALKLIQVAMRRVKQRVVVKWPQKIKPLVPPHASIEGKTIRFDMYTARSIV